MISQILRKINFRKIHLDTTGILCLYRFSSMMVTSLFFLFCQPPVLTGRKIFIICCISVSSVLLHHLYSLNIGKTSVVLLLLLGESFFNSLILVPSGGIGSPYIWYSLNTILIASIVLKGKYFCWINLGVYLFCSTWAFYSLLGRQGSFMSILKQEAYVCLSLILITGALQVISHYSDKIKARSRDLEEANNKLLKANNKIRESMNYIMELYQAVHLLTSRQDQGDLINYLIEYAKKITKTNLVFYALNDAASGKISILPGSPDTEKSSRIMSLITRELPTLRNLENPGYFAQDDLMFILAPVRCQYELHGVIGTEFIPSQDKLDKSYTLDQMRFLSELGTIALEKFELERINKGLLINEEQNRIANEIHDGVLQKLFSISCGIHGIAKRSGNLSRKKLEAELLMCQSSLNSAMSDLRSTIYGYSWKKDGANNFIIDIRNYIDTVKRYHQADVKFELTGNQELLSIDHKKSFYRIISEGIGNAIRHGNARNISVNIRINTNEALLEITDDGTGFNTNVLEGTGKVGMGVRNIDSLACSLHGSFQMNSEIGKGTSMKITVPLEYKSCREDVV